jgi:hypothetical protein
MKHVFPLLAVLLMLLAAAATSHASPEVFMVGDVRINGNFWSHQYFTGWNSTANRTADPFTIWQRVRLRTDFIANEGLKFRLGIRVNNSAWGNGTYTVDNPAPVIDVYQAFIQFKWPGTDIEFTIGMQDLDLPISSDMICANPVLGGVRGTAALVDIPVIDGTLSIRGGFYRFLDSNRDFDPTTTQVPDEFDAYFLSLPITREGFAATPWALLGVTGRNASFASVGAGGAGANQTLASNLFSAGYPLLPHGQQNALAPYWWVGGSVAFTMLDPFKFYADFIYGQGNKRKGRFLDVGAEYTGFDVLTPQLTFWYASGEDGDTMNGSERMPIITSAWGPGNSFLFDSSQEYNKSFMGVDYLGAWGFIATLDKISFVKDLSSRVSFTFAKGMNSPRALRQGVLLWGYGNYFQMGRELAPTEHVLAVNIDSQYNIFSKLALIMETGWAHGQFDSSVWGRRLVEQSRGGDAWKFTIGFRYKI